MVITNLPILLSVVNVLIPTNNPVRMPLPELFAFGVLWVLNVFSGRMPVTIIEDPIHIGCFISTPATVIAKAGVFANLFPMLDFHFTAICNAGFACSGFLLQISAS